MSNREYTVLGFVPELNFVLLRNHSTGQIEAWTRSRGVQSRSIILDGHEFEFVRDVQNAYRIPDNEHNRINAPGDIGRIYLDQPPTNAVVQELK